MTENEFRELVRRMREAQQNYFRTRHKGYLDYSRSLERQVDEELHKDEASLFQPDPGIDERSLRLGMEAQRQIDAGMPKDPTKPKML